MPGMSDTRAALLAAVRDKPDDDTPRLVYADWCDDNGEAERAEFVRLQVESARGHFGEFLCLPESPCRGCRLLQGVLRDHRFKLVGDLPLASMFEVTQGRYDGRFLATFRDSEDTIEIGFGRGFVESVRGPAGVWLRRADAILAEHPVRAVRLSDLPWVEGYEQVGDRRWLRVVGRRTWHNVPRDITTDRLTAFVLAAEWPGIAFTLPPPARTHQYSHWERAAAGEWELDIRPGISTEFGLRPLAEGWLRGEVPLGAVPSPGDYIGPLTAHGRDGLTYHVPRAVVTGVYHRVDPRRATRPAVEARTMGEFTVAPEWHAADPTASPFVTPEPRL